MSDGLTSQRRPEHWVWDFAVPFLLGAVLLFPAACAFTAFRAAQPSGMACAAWAGTGFTVCLLSYLALGIRPADERWGASAVAGGVVCVLGVAGFVAVRRSL